MLNKKWFVDFFSQESLTAKMDLGENGEFREAQLGPDGKDDLGFYITFPTPTALV